MNSLFFRQFAARLLAVGVVFAAACLSGCGPEYPDCYPVNGKITFEGQPVTQGTITFYPEEGRSAMGKIQSDGSYELTTFKPGDGAIPGKHVVTIKATQVTGASNPDSFEAELAQAKTDAPPGEATVVWLVPEPYSRRNTTPLNKTVAEEKNQIDFTLPVQQ